MRAALALLLVLLLASPAAGQRQEQWWSLAVVLHTAMPACTLSQPIRLRPNVSVQASSDALEMRAWWGPFRAGREGRWDGRAEVDSRSWRLVGHLDLIGLTLTVPEAAAPQLLEALRTGRRLRIFADRHGLVAEADLRGIADLFPAFQDCLAQLRGTRL